MSKKFLKNPKYANQNIVLAYIGLTSFDQDGVAEINHEILYNELLRQSDFSVHLPSEEKIAVETDGETSEEPTTDDQKNPIESKKGGRRGKKKENEVEVKEE